MPCQSTAKVTFIRSGVKQEKVAKVGLKTNSSFIFIKSFYTKEFTCFFNEVI